MKLDIIIPMYNAERFINDTINSVYASSLPANFYNIIVINDGSTDNSVGVVKDLMAQHGNIKLYSEPNGGTGKARNFGILNAEAEYLWFIDSDDRVAINLDIIPRLTQNYPEVDIFSYAYNWYSNNKFVGVGQRQPSVVHQRVLTGRDAILQGYQPSSVCGLIIRRSFIDDSQLFFREDITQEDVELTYRMFAIAKNVFFSNERIYDYLWREDSRSMPLSPQRIIRYQLDQMEIVKSEWQLAKNFERTDDELSLKIRQHGTSVLFGCVCDLFKHRKSWDKNIKEAVLKRMKAGGFYPLRGDMGNLKKNIFKHILNIEALYH